MTLLIFVTFCAIIQAHYSNIWKGCRKIATLHKAERINWIDIAKAITIFCVVFGHTLRGGMAQQIVYSFHVVVFFFLSGMTCKADNLKMRIKNDFLRILFPYYIFGIVSIFIFFLLGNFASAQFDMDVNTSLMKNLWELLYACPIGDKMKFNMPLWFLPCMFATKMIYYALYKLSRGKQSITLGLSVILFFVGVVYTWLGGPALPFSISVALKMLLFFTMGRSFFLHLPEVNASRGKAFLLGGLLLIVTVSVAWIFPKVDYATDKFPNIVSFLITALSGSFAICFISMGIGKCGVLESVGKSTLAILLMHKFPVLLFQTMGPLKAPLTQYDSAIGIASAVLVSIIAVLLCIIVEKIICRYFPFLLGDFSANGRKDR